MPDESLSAGLPAVLADEATAQAWSATSPGLLFSLADDRLVGLIAIRAESSVPLDDEGVRVVKLARHELAVAFRSAGLRRALDDERAELTAIVEGATDAIVQVDDACRIVRINSAGLTTRSRVTKRSIATPFRHKAPETVRNARKAIIAMRYRARIGMLAC